MYGGSCAQHNLASADIAAGHCRQLPAAAPRISPFARLHAIQPQRPGRRCRPALPGRVPPPPRRTWQCQTCQHAAGCAGNLLEAASGDGGSRAGAWGEARASCQGQLLLALTGASTCMAPTCLRPGPPAPNPPTDHHHPVLSAVQELLLHTKKLMVALAEANFYSALGVARKALREADELGGQLPAAPALHNASFACLPARPPTAVACTAGRRRRRKCQHCTCGLHANAPSGGKADTRLSTSRLPCCSFCTGPHAND